MSSSPKMSKSLTHRHTRSLGQNREKKSASSRPRISALIHKLVFYREKIFTISQPWHSLLPEAIAKVMWEGKTLDWGRSIIFTIQSLYMTALDFFFFFCSSTLYSVGCGCFFITTQKKPKICFLLIFMLCLVDARIASASRPLEWAPPSPASSYRLYSIALCTAKVLAKHVPDATCEWYRNYHQIQKSSFMELFLLAHWSEDITGQGSSLGQGTGKCSQIW